MIRSHRSHHTHTHTRRSGACCCTAGRHSFAGSHSRPTEQTGGEPSPATDPPSAASAASARGCPEVSARRSIGLHPRGRLGRPSRPALATVPIVLVVLLLPVVVAADGGRSTAPLPSCRSAAASMPLSAQTSTSSPSVANRPPSTAQQSPSTGTSPPIPLQAAPAPTTAPTPGPASEPAGERWRHPVDAPVVDGFRPPSDPYGPGNRGLQYDTALGDSVVAVAAGEVTFAGQVGGQLFVVVLHPDGLRSTYAYLDRIEVARGVGVVQGQQVAAARPGFHLTARRGGTYLDPLTLIGRTCFIVRLVPVPAGVTMQPVSPGAPARRNRAIIVAPTSSTEPE